MITVLVVLLAVSAGVVLAAVDGPYAFDKARTERVSVLVVAFGAVTMAAGGAFVMRDWLLG
jgi:hypothetical protein